MRDPFVSVIIPVLRDAGPLAELLTRLDQVGRVEVIVASGDAGDPALDAVRREWPSVRWVACSPGRAGQMNAGAEVAMGQWLLFLHADARLAEGWLDEIRRGAEDDAVGGCFRLEIDSARWQARVIEHGVRWRVRWLGLAYGDQGLFIRRDLFRATGGYRPMPVMEDADLVRRMRRLGRLRYSAVGVSVSARRWERDGWMRRTAANLRMLLFYLAGRSPDRLAASYPAWQDPTDPDPQPRHPVDKVPPAGGP
ncbi:MAG: TIGR04283 family arsenosugar biosynthesis glycosyltransferase [Vicinamibacterales bacterium]|nr:TIGR04283 family arsenosugar biosynthesis glycosyltransferase [Vicinamibacterales bacterium]